MESVHIGIELFNLSHERRVLAREGFTTSKGRVSEHLYRALLFDAPADWRYELLISGLWRPRADEAAAFQKHESRLRRFFVPPAVPLINARVPAAWQRHGQPAFYVPYVRGQSYSVLQYTSEMPWGDRPLAPVECCVAYDFHDAYVDPTRWEAMRRT